MRRTARELVRIVMGLDALAMRAAARLVHGGRDVPAEDLPAAVRGAREVLVVALAEIGDAVLLSPFLERLRDAAPHARVTLVVRPAVRSLFEHCPHVDELVSYPTESPRLLRPIILPVRAYRFARRRFRAGRFDVAVVPRWDTDHHFATAVALFSGSRRRVGYSEAATDRKRVLNHGFDRLLTDVILPSAGTHEVERHLDLARAIGAAETEPYLRAWITDADRLAPARLLDGVAAVERAPLVALGIGAAHPSRRWPVERFADLAVRLRDECSANVVIVGGPSDVEAQHAVVGRVGTGIIAAAGRLSLRETIALLQRCSLFVGNDSGPLHLAAAAGLPCVEISRQGLDASPHHHNAPERFGPWGVPAIVARPSGQRATGIADVSLEDVFAACTSLLRRPTDR